MKRGFQLLVGFIILSFVTAAFADDDDRRNGLKRKAKKELIAAGVNKYAGDFEPAVSVDFGGGWTKHTFDPDGGDGPICIAGTPYSVFTRMGNPRKLMIFMQGGGACWQDFYNCEILAENQEPPPLPPGVSIPGIFDDLNPANPVDDYSILYMPYCDGSVFSGDNDVVDASFPFGPVRFHRGLRNATAGIDLARDIFPRARKILLAGSSAGGVGVAGFAPFLVRMAFGNNRRLSVMNDAGPVAINLADTGNIQARADDWKVGQFYPESCTACDELGQTTEIIKWRLHNDRSIREGFYSTDGDVVDRFFLNVPTQELYRQLIVDEHGQINALYPDRYKRFIRSGDGEHTALQGETFYTKTANGLPLNEWVADMLKPRKCRFHDDDDDDDDDDDERRKKRRSCVWQDIVEDFVPLP